MQFKAAYDNLKAKGFDVDQWDKGTIHLIQAHSHNCLNEVIESTSVDSILFYLDAHWESHLPLLDELKHIAASGVNAVIAIHDFYVPNSGFGFDTYHGQKLDFQFIEPYLSAIYPNGYNYFYNTVAEGHKRGLIFIEPTTDRFPSDDEQPTESLAELREQILAVNKEYMTCTDQAIRSQLKDKVKEVTDKLRKMESEIGSTFSGKSAYENLKEAEQLEQPKKKRGRPSKK
jgi:hypothetical protein